MKITRTNSKKQNFSFIQNNDRIPLELLVLSFLGDKKRGRLKFYFYILFKIFDKNAYFMYLINFNYLH